MCAIEMLNKTQKNSVADLVGITKAIYIMKNIESFESSDIPTYFRFGAIGVRGSTNTAIKRLAQCVLLCDDGLYSTWEYLEIAKFPAETEAEEVKAAEQALKSTLVGKATDGCFTKVKRRDAIRTENSSELSRLFKEVVNSL